jgi:hypothetical protein
MPDVTSPAVHRRVEHTNTIAQPLLPLALACAGSEVSEFSVSETNDSLVLVDPLVRSKSF